MSNLNKLFCLAALLLAAISVPCSEHSVNAAVLRQPGGNTLSAPQVTADSLPVPWGKKPGGIGATVPQVVADSLPVPWCKAGPPHCIGVTAPKVVADSLPVPWGKKPGGTQS